MIARAIAALAALFLSSCVQQDDRTTLVVQRFFGECGAVYGSSTDIAAADTECGILTTTINRFQSENPDISLRVNVVAWPGYPQLAAQIAAGDPPDVVTMHQSVMTDYQAKGLLAPLDETLREGGISSAQLTPAARGGVMIANRTYGLPIDTIGRLFHINTRLMREAGLMQGDRPLLPSSPEELLAHARRFKAATGKPYLLLGQVAASDVLASTLYTYLLAKDAVIFPDARHIRLATPEARQIVSLFRQLGAEGLMPLDQDFPAAHNAFLAGEAGIFATGTWMIGAYEEVAQDKASALHDSYAVLPYPRLWGRPAAVVDGHAWVVPKAERGPAEQRAITRFLAHMARHNYDWARTGHLPAFAEVLKRPDFNALPHRRDIAAMAATGKQLPAYVQRQSAIQGLLAEEIEAAVTGLKPVDTALRDAERRVNELLSQML
jgi:multiple sugar transport system substrate-binding protein